MNTCSKILHVFDDSLITIKSIELFEEIDEYQHEYIIISDELNKYKSLIDRPIKLKFFPEDEVLWKKLKKEFQNYDIIFLQALSFSKAKALFWTITKNKTLIWTLWGYDLYNLVSFYNHTEKFSTNASSNNIKQKLLDYYIFKIIYKNTIKKIDICEFLLKDDFNLLKKQVKTKAEWVTNCYQTLEDFIGLCDDYNINGNQLLIGNSSTPSNNHDLVFKKLADYNVNRKIICPLSYGDMSYQKQVIELGYTLFSSNFSPIVEIQELDEYLLTLKRCSHFIMAHERQQGFGTIVLAIYLGAKVFFQKNNPIYLWLLTNGIAVFDININFENELETNLDNNRIEKNRSILEQLLSKPNIINKQREIIKKAIKIQESK